MQGPVGFQTWKMFTQVQPTLLLRTHVAPLHAPGRPTRHSLNFSRGYYQPWEQSSVEKYQGLVHTHKVGARS